MWDTLSSPAGVTRLAIPRVPGEVIPVPEGKYWISTLARFEPRTTKLFFDTPKERIAADRFEFRSPETPRAENIPEAAMKTTHGPKNRMAVMSRKIVHHKDNTRVLLLSFHLAVI